VAVFPESSRSMALDCVASSKDNLVQIDGKHPREEDSGVFGGMRAAGGDFSRFLEKTKKIVYLFRVVSVCRYTKTTGTDL
jgi:hypothetical protein